MDEILPNKNQSQRNRSHVILKMPKVPTRQNEPRRNPDRTEEPAEIPRPKSRPPGDMIPQHDIH